MAPCTAIENGKHSNTRQWLKTFRIETRPRKLSHIITGTIPSDTRVTIVWRDSQQRRGATGEYAGGRFIGG